jgi:hypothetical protein
MPRYNQLARFLDCGKAIAISESRVVTVFDFPFVLRNVRPDFVGLDFVHREVVDHLFGNLLALCASKNQCPHDRVLVQSGDSLCAQNAVSFKQELDCEQGFLPGNVHAAKRAGVRLSKVPLALRTAETSQAVSVLPEALTLDLAVRATYCGGVLFIVYHGFIVQLTLAVCQEKNASKDQHYLS